MNEKFCSWIKISLKFIPKGQINNILALIQIWPTRRQAIIWTSDGSIIYAYMRHSASMSYRVMGLRENWYYLRVIIYP